jgi:hypothetical protein
MSGVPRRRLAEIQRVSRTLIPDHGQQVRNRLVKGIPDMKVVASDRHLMIVSWSHGLLQRVRPPGPGDGRPFPYRQVSDLSRGAGEAAVDPAVEHETHADAAADREVREVLQRPARRGSSTPPARRGSHCCRRTRLASPRETTAPSTCLARAGGAPAGTVLLHLVPGVVADEVDDRVADVDRARKADGYQVGSHLAGLRVLLACFLLDRSYTVGWFYRPVADGFSAVRSPLWSMSLVLGQGGLAHEFRIRNSVGRTTSCKG